MPQLYVLRRFSSWSFQLSVSMALLLSSVGLAAGLLVGMPLGDATLRRPAWKSTPALAQVTSNLPTEQRAAMQTLPISLSSLVPAYSLTTSVVYKAPLPAAPSRLTADQAAGFASDTLVAAGSLKATIQRSWRTFKLAFR